MKIAQEEAVAWYARLQAPDCLPEERAQFERWLTRNQSNADTYAAVENFVRDLDVCMAHDARLLAMTQQARVRETRVQPLTAVPPFYKAWVRHLLPLAIAASVFLGVLLVLRVPGFIANPEQALSFTSPANEQRSLTLDDGTVASLDIDSAVTVRMTTGTRDIGLIRGRALFDVAHDAQRPFSVAVGSSRVIALGTRFQVQREGQLIIVTLEEGSVDVVGEFEGERLREQLRPGEQLRFEQGSDRWTKMSVETAAVTSWSRGRHIFRGLRLADALDEINRYSAAKVRLGNPALADLTVSGNFMTGDSHVIIAAFEAALPVRAVEDGSGLLLIPADIQNAKPDLDTVQ